MARAVRRLQTYHQSHLFCFGRSAEGIEVIVVDAPSGDSRDQAPIWVAYIVHRAGRSYLLDDCGDPGGRVATPTVTLRRCPSRGCSHADGLPTVCRTQYPDFRADPAATT